MVKPYVIEPPQPASDPVVHRPRIGKTILDKLDEILTAVTGDGDGESGGAPEGAPEVTFEPEPTQLPIESTLDGEHEEEEHEDATGQGEGTANTPELRRREFAFPGRRSGAAVR